MGPGIHLKKTEEQKTEQLLEQESDGGCRLWMNGLGAGQVGALPVAC